MSIATDWLSATDRTKAESESEYVALVRKAAENNRLSDGDKDRLRELVEQTGREPSDAVEDIEALQKIARLTQVADEHEARNTAFGEALKAWTEAADAAKKQKKAIDDEVARLLRLKHEKHREAQKAAVAASTVRQLRDRHAHLID